MYKLYTVFCSEMNKKNINENDGSNDRWVITLSHIVYTLNLFFFKISILKNSVYMSMLSLIYSPINVGTALDIF